MKKIGLSLIVFSGLIVAFYLIMVLPNIVTPSNEEIQSNSIKVLVFALFIAIIGVGIGFFLIKKSKQ